MDFLGFPFDYQTRPFLVTKGNGPFNLLVKYLIESFFKELSIVLLSGIAGLSLLFTLGA
jgi:hypothetical protein